MKWLVIIGFILIIGSLGSALFFMIKDKGQTNNTYKFLAMRVGFSISLFLLILLAYSMGWIQSSGVPIKGQ